jgi:hypothetical protein
MKNDSNKNHWGKYSGREQVPVCQGTISLIVVFILIVLLSLCKPKKKLQTRCPKTKTNSISEQNNLLFKFLELF